MNFLRKAVRNARYYGTQCKVTGNYFAEELKQRSLIRVQGNEIKTFLQGLITNDIDHLCRKNQAIYTMFLNKAGRVLYDSIIYRTTQNDTYLIECDKNISIDLERHLKLFRVRRKIDIVSLGSEYKLWVVFSSEAAEHASNNTADVVSKEGQIVLSSDELSKSESSSYVENLSEEAVICRDPRTKAMGIRLILPDNYTIENLQEILSTPTIQPSLPDNDYQLLRYKLGISEGMLELPPAKCFPIEANCDYLHGISFHKGCYLGQEFTARTYHTGVIRKRIMPFQVSERLTDIPESIEMPNRNVVGKIRGFKDIWGIALVRIEQALEAVSLYVNTIPTKVIQPSWWPRELPTKDSVKQRQI